VKNKSSMFFLVLALMMLVNVIIVSAALCNEDYSLTDDYSGYINDSPAMVTQTDAVPRYWKGWQEASISPEAQVFEDEQMTEAMDISSVQTGKVIICETKGSVCKIRVGSKTGWIAKDALTVAGDPVLYNDGDAINDPVSLKDTEIAARLDKVARQYGCVGAQVAVIKDGQISHLYEYGYQDKRQKIPVTSSTKVRVASTTKIIVGMGVMSMQDMGILDIDTDISTYWGQKITNPDYPDTPITMSSLMTHTSSLKDFGYKQRATSVLEKRLQSEDSFTKHKPGDPAGYMYNNSGICTVGAVAGRAADINFDRYIREYFFQNLGIDASFHINNIRGQDKVSILYNDGTPIIRVQDMTEIPYYGGPGDDYSLYAGGMIISAKDLGKMLCILIGDGQYDGMYYLKQESVDKMLERRFSCDDYEQCLILRYRDNLFGGGRTMYYHNGNLSGVYSLACFDPDSGDGMVVISVGSQPAKLEEGVYNVCGDLAAVAAELWSE